MLGLFSFMRTVLALAIPFLLLSSSSQAQGVDVRFERTQGTAWGESLYLLGDLPELGGGDPTRALRMVPGNNHRWTLNVSLPTGAAYRYVYLVRDNDASQLANPQNARRVGDIVSARVPGSAAQRIVRVRYYSGFQQVYLTVVNESRQVQLQRAKAGRNGSEWIWEAEVRTTARELVFELHDGHGKSDRAPGGGAYRTGHSTFTLVDGRIQPGKVGVSGIGSAQGRIVSISNWRSNILGNSRDVFIYLPPGYDRSSRRYPVLYAHDGQNLFGPDALFGGWRLESAADQAINSGQAEPMIIVGLGNTRQRMSEYMPDEDGGTASRYGRFLSDEIKPWVDRTLRTRPEREHTGLIGSSLGGIVSVYLAWTRPEVFGRAGSLSGSFWLRGWVDRLGPTPRQSLRIWIDSGNQGGSRFDSLEDTLWVRDLLLRRGYSLGQDVQHFVDYGASHNERYWRARVGDVLRHLFPAR